MALTQKHAPRNSSPSKSLAVSLFTIETSTTDEIRSVGEQRVEMKEFSLNQCHSFLKSVDMGLPRVAVYSTLIASYSDCSF